MLVNFDLLHSRLIDDECVTIFYSQWFGRSMEYSGDSVRRRKNSVLVSSVTSPRDAVMITAGNEIRAVTQKWQFARKSIQIYLLQVISSMWGCSKWRWASTPFSKAAGSRSTNNNHYSGTTHTTRYRAPRVSNAATCGLLGRAGHHLDSGGPWVGGPRRTRGLWHVLLPTFRAARPTSSLARAPRQADWRSWSYWRMWLR